MTHHMINKLLSRPGITSICVRKTHDNNWFAVAEMQHGQHNCAVTGTTPHEALDNLARVMGITPDSAAHDFPTTRNTSAGELRRMHEEAEEKT